MSQTKAHPAHEEARKPGETLETAMHDADRHNQQGDQADPVPPAETGGHAHSAAAHLESSGDPHTKPAGNLRQGSHPGALREPPTVVQRVGKQHR